MCQHGYTSLLVASLHGNVGVIQLLLENGADVDVRGVVSVHCTSPRYNSTPERKYFLNVDADGRWLRLN